MAGESKYLFPKSEDKNDKMIKEKCTVMKGKEGKEGDGGRGEGGYSFMSSPGLNPRFVGWGGASPNLAVYAAAQMAFNTLQSLILELGKI